MFTCVCVCARRCHTTQIVLPFIWCALSRKIHNLLANYLLLFCVGISLHRFGSDITLRAVIYSWDGKMNLKNKNLCKLRTKMMQRRWNRYRRVVNRWYNTILITFNISFFRSRCLCLPSITGCSSTYPYKA